MVKDMSRSELQPTVFPYSEVKVSGAAKGAMEVGKGSYGVAEASNLDLLRAFGLDQGVPVEVFSFGRDFFTGSVPDILKGGVSVFKQGGRSVVVPGSVQMDSESKAMSSLDSVVAEVAKNGRARIAVPEISGLDLEKVKSGYLPEYEQKVLRSPEAAELLKTAGALVFDSGEEAMNRYKNAREKYRALASETKRKFVDSWRGVVDGSGTKRLPGSQALAGVAAGMAAVVPAAEAAPAIVAAAPDLAEKLDNWRSDVSENLAEFGNGNYITIPNLLGTIGAVRLDTAQANGSKAMTETMTGVKRMTEGEFRPELLPTATPEIPDNTPFDPPEYSGAGGGEFTDPSIAEAAANARALFIYGAHGPDTFATDAEFLAEMDAYARAQGFSITQVESPEGGVATTMVRTLPDGGKEFAYYRTSGGAVANVQIDLKVNESDYLTWGELPDGATQLAVQFRDGRPYYYALDVSGKPISVLHPEISATDRLVWVPIESTSTMTVEDMSAMSVAERKTMFAETFATLTPEQIAATVEIEPGAYKLAGATVEQDRYFDLVTGREFARWEYQALYDLSREDKSKLPEVLFFNGEVLRFEMDTESSLALAQRVTVDGVTYNAEGIPAWKNAEGEIVLVEWAYVPTRPDATELMSVAQSGRLIVLQPVGTGGNYDFTNYTASEVEADLQYAALNGKNRDFIDVVNDPNGVVISVIGLQDHLPESENVAGTRVYWEGVGNVPVIPIKKPLNSEKFQIYSADRRENVVVSAMIFIEPTILDLVNYPSYYDNKRDAEIMLVRLFSVPIARSAFIANSGNTDPLEVAQNDDAVSSEIYNDGVMWVAFEQ